ncbi:MAG: hypothetical protein ACYDEJ_09540 [Desulfitobacteriaceae bacterium]
MNYKKVGRYQRIISLTWEKSDAGYYIDYNAKPANPAFNPFHSPNFIPDNNEGPYLFEKPYTTRKVKIKPLEENPTLFVEFAELNGTDEGFLSFVNEYGLLSDGRPLESIVNDSVLLQTLFEYKTLPDPKLMRTALLAWLQRETKGESLVSVRRIHSEFKMLVERWNSIRERNKSAVGDLFQSNQTEELKNLISDINTDLRQYPVQTEIGLGDLDTTRIHFVPSSLIGAMYFQLAWVVAGERRIEQCSVCRRWEDVTENKITWTMHDSCATGERNKKFRAIKDYQSGMPISELSTKYKRPESKINEWISEAADKKQKQAELKYEIR